MEKLFAVADKKGAVVYVWGVPNVPKHVAGLQPFSEELAAYLATHHHVTTYKFDNANPYMPYFVPVATPLDTLALPWEHPRNGVVTKNCNKI